MTARHMPEQFLAQRGRGAVPHPEQAYPVLAQRSAAGVSDGGIRALTQPLGSAAGWLASMPEGAHACAKERVMDIYADMLEPAGRLVWLGSLVALVAPFGINERALRTAVFRLVGQRWLSSVRCGRRSAYAVAPAALEAAAAARALADPICAAEWGGGWTLAMVWCARLHPGDAGPLHALLTECGYRMIQTGVYGRPGGDPDALARRCVALGVQDRVVLFDGACAAAIAPQALNARVARLWELERLAARYRKLTEAAAQLRALLSGAEPEAAQAYVITVLLRGWLRRIRRDDPLLPAGVLPPDWAGTQAEAAVGAVLAQLNSQARRHVAALLDRPQRAPAGHHRA